MSVQTRETRPQDRTNTLAIVSFVSSFVISIAGIVTGHMALRQIRRTGEGGRGLAIAGLVIGYASVAVTLILVGTAVVATFALHASVPASAPPATKDIDAPTVTSSPSAAPTAPPASLAQGRTWKLSMTLDGKSVNADLFGDRAPQAVASFTSLANAGFFNGTKCHRLTTSGIFVLQCGDPSGTGTGGPDYRFGPIENAPASEVYKTGYLAMARQGNDASSMGSQFFIIYKDSPIPNDSAGGYTVFGQITQGLPAVEDVASKGAADGSADGQPATPAVIDAVTAK